MVGNYDRRQKSKWLPGIVAAVFGLFLAWQAGLLPFEFGQTETGQLVTEATPPPIEALPEFPDINAVVDGNSPVAGQSEPAAFASEDANPFAEEFTGGNSGPPPAQFEPAAQESTAEYPGANLADQSPFPTAPATSKTAATPDFDNPFEDSPAATVVTNPNPRSSGAGGSGNPFESAGNLRPVPPQSGNALASDITEIPPDFEDPFAENPPPARKATNAPPMESNVAQALHSDRTGNNVRQVAGAESGFSPSKSADTTLRSAADLQPFLANVDRLIEEDDYLTAHSELSKKWWTKKEWRDAMASRIQKTARAIYAASQPDYVTPYRVQPGDTLGMIAKRYKVPWQYLARLNDVEETKVRAGQKLKVTKGPFDAVVDLSEFELTLHAHGYYVHRYTIGVGKDGTSPIGKFRVKQKVKNPTYYGRDQVIDADDPNNPLGEYWIDLGDSYGIHGTTNPDSIGKAQSRGCIRMRNNEIAEVFQMLSEDSTVMIRR